MPLKDVQYNAAKWAAQLFGTVGQMRVTERVYDWTIELQIEGVPAHDPDCVVAVRKAFCGFVEKGWGPLAMSGVSVEILAGDLQDGKPRQQVVVMPSIVDGGLS